MKRALIRWWISDSLDRSSGKRSKWLQTRIDADPELRRFEQAADRLDAALRVEAAEWIARQDLDADNRAVLSPRHAHAMQPSSSPGRGTWAACAVAAIVLLAVSLFGWARFSSTENAIVNASPVPMDAVDSQALQELFAASHAIIRPFADSTAFQRRMEVPLLPSTDWDERARQQMERFYGDMKHSFDRDRRHMTEDLKSAIAFFAHSLPQSTANLIGLRGSG